MIIDSPIISGSYAASGSLNQVGDITITGSLTVTGNISGTATSASYALTASHATNVPQTASFADSATSASFASTASFSLNVPVTSSYANNATSASFATTASYLTGYISPFPYTGSAIISGSLTVTGSVAVDNLQGVGVRYLVTDASGSVTAQTASAAIKQTQAFTSSANQTSFTIDNGYTTGLVDVYINGSKLAPGVEFTDTSGTVITLATGSNSGDLVEFVKYFPASGVTNNALRQLTTFTASAGQTVFSASYTPGLLDIFYNGSRLSTSDYTANTGTYFTLATASAADDILDVLVYSYQVGGFSGIGGTGSAAQVAYFSTGNAITGSPNFTISGSTMTVTGSLTVSGSGTFTNIGPAVFSGSITSTAGFTGSFSGVATSASFASTASSADNLLVRNTLTAQTLVVQTITSSVDFVTGSTRFGSLAANTHTFTGSVLVSGSIGVGTTSPTYPLTVNGNVAVGGQQAFILRDDDGFSSNSARRAWAITANYSAFGMLSFFVANATASNPLGATAAMNITSGGNVGIGTTNPGYKLEVQTNSTSASLWVQTGGTTSAYTIADFRTGTNASALQILGNAVAVFGGNVGIGTNTPLAKLDLNDGNIRMGQYLNSASTYIGKAAAVNSNFYSSVQFYSTSGEDAIIFNTHLSGVSAGERMRITGRGNIGVGIEPSNWATLTPIQIKNAAFAGYSTGNTHILYAGSNFYYDGNGDKYISNGYASLYSQALGEHNWSSGGNNSSGAGASLTLTGNMKLSQPGDLYLYNGSIQQQGVWTVFNTGYTSGASAFTFDVGVDDEGGGGNIFKVEAGFAHYFSMAYNCLAEFYISSRGTNTEITDVKRYDSANAGSFTAYKPTSSILRIAKNAGTYGGGGRYWIKVTKVNY